MQAAEIEIQVRDLVVSKFAFGRKDQLRDEESLLEDHIDSSGVIETRNVSAGALRDFGINVRNLLKNIYAIRQPASRPDGLAL